VLQDVQSTVVETIVKDVGRTFPNLKPFATEKGRRSLQNVLLAYAAYDPEVGYCQGMNFLAGLLLLYLPDEEIAFGALVTLMKERGLRDFYTEDMGLLEVDHFKKNPFDFLAGFPFHVEATVACQLILAPGGCGCSAGTFCFFLVSHLLCR